MAKHKVLSLIASAAVIAATVALAIFTPAPASHQPVAFLSATANKYERAQAATCIVETPHGYGTGFIMQRGTNLFVWTARHVVATSDEVQVGRFVGIKSRHSGNLVFTARVISRFKNLDIALLQIDAPLDSFAHLSFGADATIGAPLFHVGNFWGPGFDASVSLGIVSQLGVQPGGEGWPWRLVDQGDFAAMPGSSGGPVFNVNGEVIGVLVGGPHRGSDRICCYVPVREIRAEAEAEGVAWAVEGRSVDDKFLDFLADHAKLPVPVVLKIEIVTPKKK